MLSAIKKVFGTKNERYLRQLQPLVDQINGYEDEYKKLTDKELTDFTAAFKERLQKGETLEGLLPEAFAAVKEATRRALGTPHYDVQLVGGIVLHRGRIAEMKTGEGKTQVAALAVYLNALEGKGVHVVTVNDYLAKRDAEWMGQVYGKLGMTCKAIVSGMTPDERKEAYNADVTYATNNELGFDYLRDNMAFSTDQLVQRELNFAIVDEVDSILIDESRTPLIISGALEDKTDMYVAIDKIIPKLNPETDYEVDEKARNVTLTDVGTDHAEELLAKTGLMEEGSNLYDITNVMLVHHINQALRAHALFTKDVEYIIKDNEVVIIDEFTGRMMPGRRYSEGLHQAIEAKEGVEIKTENQTLASITFQNYFRMYNKLAGMTGTADTEAEEFESIYGLSVTVIPTNVPIARDDEADTIYLSREAKMKAIVDDIKDCYERGQPVLVGTTSIEKSEELDAILKKEKIPHNVLNARFHEQEADIVAQAGRLGAVTIATNMAGRGTDIKLGGSLELLLEDAKDEKDAARIRQEHEEEKEAVMEAGGLRIVGTERHESRRIDNQLRGRSGRQGDVGSSVFYISLQDDFMRIFASNLDGLMKNLDYPEDEAIQSRLVSKAIETAQRKIEGRNFDIRKTLLKFDDVLNEQRKVIYDQRREILESETVDDIVLGFREEALEEAFSIRVPAGTYLEQWDINGLKEDMLRLYDITPDIDAWLEEDGVAPEDIFERALKRVQDVWEEKEKRLGSDVMRRLEKIILLQVFDQRWKDHLQRLEYLRQGIGLRGFAQKDPVNEYKREAFEMFAELLDALRDETVMLLARVEVQKDKREQLLAQGAGEQAQKMAPQQQDVEEDPYADQRVPRNSPCPCGSGKKYKHCHGRLPAARKTA